LVFLAGLVAGLYGVRISTTDMAGLQGVQEPPRTGARVEIGGLGSRVVALEDRAAELDAQVARLRAAGDGPLSARIDAAEAAVRRLEQDSRGLATLSRRLDVTEGAVARVNALEGRMAVVEGVPATVSGLAIRLATIEAAVQRLPEIAARAERTEGVADSLPQLVLRLEQLEEAEPEAAPLTALPPDAQPGELLERLSNLDVRLNALEDGGRVESLLTSLQAIEERLAAVELGAGRAASIEDVATVENRLAVLELRTGGSASAEDLATVAARIEELESGIAGAARAIEIEAIGARIDPLESALASTARAAEVAAFEKRVAALEKAPASARRAAALVIAVGQLRGAVSAGRPYAPELDGLQIIAAPLGDSRLDSAIVALGERAPAGVPSLDNLRQRFSSLATRLVHADALGPDPDWVDKTLDRLSSVVSVRRVGDIEGADVEAKVARAEARLAEGNLEEAVANLADLQGAASLALEVWLADARARLAADRAISELNERTAVHLQAS
jgi:hypothetical protein